MISPLAEQQREKKDGGAAESTRAILAYHISVLDMISHYGEETLAPFIVDTPRQHEQNDFSYENIIDLLLNKTLKQQQVFLCAVNNSLLAPFQEKANVIKLNSKDKLLQKAQYDELRKELEPIINA